MIEKPPCVSIVMPTRNQAAFLPSAVESVLAQALGAATDVELVVADGASTDGTPELLASLAARHPERIRWVSEPDAGPADAVNKAVRMAAAPLIGWLNSDDLYTPGAAARAVTALQAHPDRVMVYGEGEHVDLHGAPLGRYPTRTPDTPLSAWRDGCHICQPTAFFRRDAFLALGGLDTGLRTAFDYEFWLRLFKAHAGQIGFVHEVQAQSRLHAEGITLRMRELVAMEGMEVVHRHLGAAPPHWLVTHVGEALAACPFDADADIVRAHLLTLADRAAAWLAPGVAETLKRKMKAHRAWQMVRSDFAVDVHPDGWAPPVLVMRLRQRSPQPYRTLRLWCRHSFGGVLRLHTEGMATPWQGGCSRPGPFQITIPLPLTPGEQLSLRLVADRHVVPADSQPGSQDRRALAFLLDAVELA
jgi:glycosyltransferase involved in cell wall biosynthesis